MSQQPPSTGTYPIPGTNPYRPSAPNPLISNPFINTMSQQPPSTSTYPPVWNNPPVMNDQQQQPPEQNYSTARTYNYNNNPLTMNQQQTPVPWNNPPMMMNDQQQQTPLQNYPTASTYNCNNPPMMMNDQQQQTPVQNYPTASTYNCNNNPMIMNQQQPPVQNFQHAASTTNATGSNFFMGHPTNPLPNYTKPVVMVGSKYCSPNPVDLIITRKIMHLSMGNFVVEDVNGNLLFKVRDGIQLLRDRRVVRDAQGHPVVTMQEKIMTAHHRWNVFKGDSREPKDLLFCAKETSMMQLRTKLDVFLPSNGNEGICDFRVKGSWGERSCLIYGGDSNVIIAQMHKKTTPGSVVLGKDKFTVTVYPNIDCAFIVSLVVILDAINHVII